MLVRELSLAELDAIAREATKDKTLTNDEFEGRVISACVCDPETKQPIKDDWQFWGKLGTSFLPIRKAVIRLNRLNDDSVGEAEKK